MTAAVAPARVLAALEVLGFPDDREASAHVEDDGHQLTERGQYWELVSDVISAADAAASQRPCRWRCARAGGRRR